MSDEVDQFVVVASALFEDDLDAAVRYRKQAAGKHAALRLLDSYEEVVERLESFPSYGPRLRENLRWCEIDGFVAIYEVDTDAHRAILHRFYYMTSDWKRRILE